MMFPNWAKNILFLLVYMISGLILVIIIEGLMTGTELMPLNTVVESTVMRVRTPLLTTFFVIITKLGNAFFLSAATILIAILLFIRGRAYDAILFVMTMFVAVSSLTVLKNTFQINRPGSEIIEVNGWSFPSGHATVATAFFFILALTFFRNMKTAGMKILLVFVSIMAAALVCLSRLYLGAHWTLDILAGAALGLLSVSFTVLMFGVFVGDKRALKNIINS